MSFDESSRLQPSKGALQPHWQTFEQSKIALTHRQLKIKRSKSSIRPTNIKPAIIQYPRVRLNSPPKIPINVMISAGTNRLIVILSHSNARKTPSPIACRLIYKLADSMALFIRASTTAFSAASLPALSNCLASSRSDEILFFHSEDSYFQNAQQATGKRQRASSIMPALLSPRLPISVPII